MLTLLQQGNEEAEIFVGNNTRERNGKGLITGMLQEHLQKIGNVALRQKPNQATDLLDTEPQKLPDKEQQEDTKTESTTNHTAGVEERIYLPMPEVDVRTI